MLQRPPPQLEVLCHHLLHCWPTLLYSPAPAKMVIAMAMAKGKSIFLAPLQNIWLQFLIHLQPNLDFLPLPRLPPPSCHLRGGAPLQYCPQGKQFFFLLNHDDIFSPPLLATGFAMGLSYPGNTIR